MSMRRLQREEGITNQRWTATQPGAAVIVGVGFDTPALRYTIYCPCIYYILCTIDHVRCTKCYGSSERRQ